VSYSAVKTDVTFVNLFLGVAAVPPSNHAERTRVHFNYPDNKSTSPPLGFIARTTAARIYTLHSEDTVESIRSKLTAPECLSKSQANPQDLGLIQAKGMGLRIPLGEKLRHPFQTMLTGLDDANGYLA
jgi:hypothetical protein